MLDNKKPINGHFNYALIFLSAAALFLIGCDGAKRGGSQPSSQTTGPSQMREEEILAWLPAELPGDLPASRYLSKQDTENPKVGQSNRGYDPDYRMLRPRRLEGKLERNLLPTDPGYNRRRPHIPGVSPDAIVIRKPRKGETITSKQLIDLFLGNEFLADPRAKFPETKSKIMANRKASLARQGARPRVLVSGLGPVGLLMALEAYLEGSSVIAIEQRSQYTRPQILRLTDDTIDRITYFVGKDLWDYMRNFRGVVSKSPNWAPNKYDLKNRFLYENKTEQQALSTLTPAEKAEREDYIKRGFELDTVDIIRINHLETILAAVLEKLAQDDPDHLRIYYGGEVHSMANPDSFGLELKLLSGNATATYPVVADVIAATEGGGSEIAKNLNLKSSTISNKLYGSTVALRLPVGFDIGLRPIENRDGSASVKGIAEIDKSKLGSWEGYTWSMIGESELCTELNTLLAETAAATKTADPDNGILLPCGIPAANLSAPWNKRNGGKDFFLPRTRYFFTGGIAYMGAELSQRQLEMFEKGKKKDIDPAISAAAKRGHRRFLLTLAKKHMPREYVEGQGPHTILAPASEGNDTDAADNARVITITEENYSLTLFPIELKKANQFFAIFKLKDGDSKARAVRVVQEGDTYATTHFFTGSGAVNGLRAATFAGQALNAGGIGKDWEKAAIDASTATDAMHRKVMYGEGNAPLDGPFNEPL